jgi:hypothetical protein
MSVRLDTQGRIFTEQYARPAAGHAGDFAIISRHGGLLLRSVVINPKQTAASD